MASIKSVKQLLEIENLSIPNYQRPYKWTIKNVEELLNDISSSIEDAGKFKDFKYRIGTIIVYDNGEVKEIVDGQQRIITLTLIYKYLDEKFNNSILNGKFSNKISQKNIHDNYTYIREWFSLKNDEEKRIFRNAFRNILEVVLISVGEIYEAFQLFDSQNTRGKELDPHDLLKAYHLREMKEFPYEMNHAVTKWEAKEPKKIRELFEIYLFPIWNWSFGFKSKTFTSKEIDTYKGIGENSQYTYAKRASKSIPYFQITEPFISGNDFFEMVDHYMNLLNDVEKELNNNPSFTKIKEIMEMDNTNSVGFKYTENLFKCALLCYYDKFHNFEERAVKKMFLWAFMLRADMKNLGLDSINKYAIGGEDNKEYTNSIALFSTIRFARLHNEISSLQIVTQQDIKKKNKNKKIWNDLCKKLGEMNGDMED